MLGFLELIFVTAGTHPGIGAGDENEDKVNTGKNGHDADDPGEDSFEGRKSLNSKAEFTNGARSF